jgi:hypothetical protein
LVYLEEQEDEDDEEGKEEGKGLNRPARRKKQRPGPAISKPAGQRRTSACMTKRSRSSHHISHRAKAEKIQINPVTGQL